MKGEDRKAAPTFAPLAAACAEHGISRSAAYRLVADGDLQTFLIGRRRYVLLDSLRTLPERLAKKGGRHGRR